MIVLVEGNIGSGKSTFLDFLQVDSEEKITVLKEPISEWRNYGGHNVLKGFYENPGHFALRLQLVVQLTFLKILKNCTDPTMVYVLERGSFSARGIFAELLADDQHLAAMDLTILDDFMELCLTPFIPRIQLIVYLKTAPEVALERVKKRQRPEEAEITLPYLQKLDLHYDSWINRNCFPLKAKIEIVNVNEDFNSLLPKFANIKACILNNKYF